MDHDSSSMQRRKEVSPRESAQHAENHVRSTDTGRRSRLASVARASEGAEYYRKR
jgi:hypothetical protein